MTDWINRLTPEYKHFLSEQFNDKSENEVRSLLYRLGFSDFKKKRADFLQKNNRGSSVEYLVGLVEKTFGNKRELVIFIDRQPKTFIKPTIYSIYDVQLPSYMDKSNNWNEIYNCLVKNWKALTSICGTNKQIYVFTAKVANMLEFLEKRKDALGFIPKAPPAPTFVFTSPVAIKIPSKDTSNVIHTKKYKTESCSIIKDDIENIDCSAPKVVHTEKLKAEAEYDIDDKIPKTLVNEIEENPLLYNTTNILNIPSNIMVEDCDSLIEKFLRKSN